MDGLEIPAYLTPPKGVPGKNLAVLIIFPAWLGLWDVTPGDTTLSPSSSPIAVTPC